VCAATAASPAAAFDRPSGSFPPHALVFDCVAATDPLRSRGTPLDDWRSPCSRTGEGEEWIGGGHPRSDIAPPCRQLVLQAGREVGLFGGAVAGFAGIGNQVEEFEATVLEVFNELPLARAQRPAGRGGRGVVIVGEMEEQRLASEGSGGVVKQG